MEIYSYRNEKVNASADDIFSVINDDNQLKDIFTILKEVEYNTKEKRAKGTKFRITLGVRNKTYRFRNEIVEYSENRSITMKTKLKQGVITTLFNIVPNGDHSELTVRSSIDSKMGVRMFVMTVKPIVKAVMNKEMNKLVKYLEDKSA